MDVKDLASHIDGRLDRIEGKLDNHLERIATVEATVHSVRGQVKTIVMAFMGIVAYLAKYIFDTLTSK